MNGNYGIDAAGRVFQVAVCCLLLLVAGSSVASGGGVLDKLSNRSDVATFLDVIVENAYLESTVGDFRKLDLDGDGRMELLASVDYSGRGFFNTLFVVWADEEGLRYQKFETWNLESLEGVVEDLDLDGRQELLTRQLLTPYLGARPHAAWTTVRALDDGEYVESSSRFGHFYESRILPALENKLERLGEAGDNRLLEMATEVELAKVLWTLGRSDSEAVLHSAMQWAEEPDPVGRIFATSVLKELEVPAADRVLQRLAEDSNDEVALYAVTALKSKQQRD